MPAGGPVEFSAKVLDGLMANPFARVVVPCGRSTDSAVEALRLAAFDRDQAPLIVDLGSIVTQEGFFSELSTVLGCMQPFTDVEGLITVTNVFCQPRIMIIVRLFDDDLITHVIKAARLVADVTRDFPAPIRFIWLHDASVVSVEPTVPYEVWPAEWRDIPLLEFAGGMDTVLYRAFRLYLDRRVYWEAAGQSDRVRELSECVSVAGGITISTRAVDDALNRIFDAAPITDEDRRTASSYLAEPEHVNHWLHALRQNVFPKVDVDVVKRWSASGLVWRPPGFSRWRITPMCIRVLAEDANHPITAMIGRSQVVAQITYARANPQISQMVLILTTQVECELLDAIRAQVRWDSLVDACGIRDDIERSRQRAQLCQDSFVKTDNSLLDYATFGQLLYLAQAAGHTFQFPISRDWLWDIVSLRNLAAHGHPVRWDGLRRVVEAVYSLGVS